MSEPPRFPFPKPVQVLQTKGGKPTMAVKLATVAAAHGHRLSAWYPYEDPPEGLTSQWATASSSCLGCLAYLIAYIDDGLVKETDPAIFAPCPDPVESSWPLANTGRPSVWPG